MIVRCRCGAAYEMKDEWAGKSVRCPKCSQEFVATPVAAQPRPATVAAAAGTDKSATAPRSNLEKAQLKEREERESQLIAQYVPYKPKPGSKLRGKALAKATEKAERRERLGGMLRLVGLGVGLIAAAIFGYFRLAQIDAGEIDEGKVHWIMAFLYSIGGKWTASIGLGLIALGVIAYGVMYFFGVVGQKREK